MTVPTTEAAIYANPVRTGETRIIMGLDYPAWTETYHDAFTSALSAVHYRFLLQPGPPLVTGGKLTFLSYGVPPFESVQPRVKTLPRDPNIAFAVTITCTFPEPDPLYSQGFVLGSLDGDLGPNGDTWVIQHGSGLAPNFPGRIVISPPNAPTSVSALNDFVQEYDGAEHEYRFEWRPGGGGTLKIILDGDEIFDEVCPRPYYIGFGIRWTTTLSDVDGVVIEALGDAEGGAVAIMEIGDLEVDELDGGGFEVREYPAWITETSADATDPDDALPGELIDMDGQIWAILPDSIAVSWERRTGLSQQAATFQITLTPTADDVDALHWPHYNGRDILIDTRVSSEDGTASWKRQIAGTVQRVAWSISGAGTPALTLSGSCRVMAKLDDTVQFTDMLSDEALAGVHNNYTFQQLFEAIVEIANAISGDVLGPIDIDINAPNIIPDELSDGGQALIAAISDWADRLVQELRVRYTATGASRYGTLCLNLWDTVPGTPYAFTISNVRSASLDDDTRRAPGRVTYDPNLRAAALANDLVFVSQGAMGYAAFPAFPYPERRKQISDSIAYANDLATDPSTSFPDRSGSAQFGGIAKLRWQAEVGRQRQLSLSVGHHDWIEPGDSISFDGGVLVDVAETWIVDTVTIKGNAEGITSDLTAFTTDIIGAVTRGG